MKELEYMKKETNPVSKAPPEVSHPPKIARLRTMSTEELVKLLMSPELAQPVNAVVRQQIIEILQKREGNAFVQRLRGKTAEKKSMGVRLRWFVSLSYLNIPG